MTAQTMTDRELLEKAARSVGLEPLMWCGHRGWLCETTDNTPRYYWNPLTDDGDALRLAVKLNFAVDVENDTVWSFNGLPGASGFYELADDKQDIFAATRRAIVRAAAALGESA